MKKIKIAVDGHSSCGKSTLAKQIAKHFGFTYIDTGAMYRTIALYAMRNGMIAPDDTINQEALQANIGNVKVSFLKNGHAALDGEDVENQIRTLEVSSKVSKIAALKFVREAMVDLQRNFRYRRRRGARQTPLRRTHRQRRRGNFGSRPRQPPRARPPRHHPRRISAPQSRRRHPARQFVYDEGGAI